MKLFRWLAVTAALCASLAGCSVYERNPDVANLAIKYATMKVIDAAADPSAKAERIVEVVQTAIDVTADEAVLISAIEQAVRNAVDWDSLARPDALLAHELINVVSDRLQERVGEGLISGERLITVREVLDSVIEAAEFYV